MFSYRLAFIIFALAIGAKVQAANSGKSYQAQIRAAQTLVRILEEQPDSIEQWSTDRAYLSPERIQVTRQGVFISHLNSSVEIPAFSVDQQGLFILCSKKEAQEHYDRSSRALAEAGAYCAGAALSIECPPAAIISGYLAVESIKEWAKEHCEGVKCEKEGEKND